MRRNALVLALLQILLGCATAAAATSTPFTGRLSTALSGQLDLGLFQEPLAHLIVPFTSAGVDGIGLGGDLVIATSSGIGVSVRGAP